MQISVTQNTQLSNISALYGYAGCATNPTNQSTPVPIIIQVCSQLNVYYFLQHSLREGMAGF